MIGWTPWISPAADQPVNDKLLTFQKFVNGEIPVKEAVVFRKITSTNGAVLNQEWWRCGWQANTWYCQRLTPDTNDLAELVPLSQNEVIGESFTHAWIISDKNIHVAAKIDEAGSIIDTHGAFPRELLFRTVSLGIPRMMNVHEIDESLIEWSNLDFHTMVATAWNSKGVVISNAPLAGKLTLDERGCPILAEFSSVGNLGGGAIAYEYVMENDAIPRAYTLKYPDREYRYEFISLDLTSNNLANPDGYVPPMFADPRLERFVNIWTNNRSYSLVQGKLYPNFGVKMVGQNKSHSGLIILISLAVSLAIILTFWHRRSR